MRRWLSGLRRTIGNRVTANTRPEVQILFSAPYTDESLIAFVGISICVRDRFMKKIYEYITPYSKEYIKENMPSLVEKFSKDNQREFLYEDKGQNEIWIGIEKGDHAGYWFIADLQETCNGTRISGHIEYDPQKNSAASQMNLFSKICLWFLAGILCLLFCVPIIIYQIYKLIKKTKTKEQYLDIFLEKYLQCEKMHSK